MGAAARLRHLVKRVHELDLAIDDWVEQVRSPALDPVFYGLSSAADHGLIWLGHRLAHRGPPRRPGASGCAWAPRWGGVGPHERARSRCASGGSGPRATSRHEPLPYGMHRPITSSFPSGHAASAFTAAVLLADSPFAPAYFLLAAGIAASRVYVRMHHTSDIVAGRGARHRHGRGSHDASLPLR